MDSRETQFTVSTGISLLVIYYIALFMVNTKQNKI